MFIKHNPEQILKLLFLYSLIAVYNLFLALQVDMGSSFDFFGPISDVGHAQISPAQQHNRQMLFDFMSQQNFKVYPMEWWHFTHQPAVYTETYFDFVIQ
jgi:D-alanyl-D-alanine dipeptidase